MIKTNNFKYSALAKVGAESIAKLKRELYLNHDFHPDYCVLYVSSYTFMDLMVDARTCYPNEIYYDEILSVFMFWGVPVLIETNMAYGEIKGVVCEHDELVARCDGAFVEQGEDRDSC